MELGFNLKDFLSGKKKDSGDDDNDDKKDGVPDVFTGELLAGRKKSILEVAGTIRTGVRIGSITRQTAYNSKKINYIYM